MKFTSWNIPLLKPLSKNLIQQFNIFKNKKFVKILVVEVCLHPLQFSDNKMEMDVLNFKKRINHIKKKFIRLKKDNNSE